MKLRAPADCTAVSHGGREFEIRGGIAEVPEEVVEVLREAHGFTNGAEAAEAPRRRAKGS